MKLARTALAFGALLAASAGCANVIGLSHEGETTPGESGGAGNGGAAGAVGGSAGAATAGSSGVAGAGATAGAAGASAGAAGASSLGGNAGSSAAGSSAAGSSAAGASSGCLATCGGACTDLTSDPSHCGKCDVACDAGVTCVQGVCGRTLWRGSSGAATSYAIDAAKHLVCWGLDDRNECGLAASTGTVPPTLAKAVTAPVLQVTDAFATTCALLDGGQVLCLGSNHYGEIGDGSSGGSLPCALPEGCSTGAMVDLPLPAVEIVAGGSWCGASHTCARLTDGTLSCWGDLGRCMGSSIASVPTPVAGLDHAVAMAAGSGFTCALRDDGTVWCWGADDTAGVLGTGDTTPHLTPAPIPDFSATAIAGGVHHVCALRDGSVWCWGFNRSGQVGAGPGAPDSIPQPTQVMGVSDAIDVACSLDASCALTASGDVYCWGLAAYGELPGVSATDTCADGACRATAAKTVLGDVTELAATVGSFAARKHDGTYVLWGQNSYGQLGNGKTTGVGPVSLSTLP